MKKIIVLNMFLTALISVFLCSCDKEPSKQIYLDYKQISLDYEKELSTEKQNKNIKNFLIYLKDNLGDNNANPFKVTRNISDMLNKSDIPSLEAEKRFNSMVCKYIFSELKKTDNFSDFINDSRLLFRFTASLSPDNKVEIGTLMFWAFVGEYTEDLMKMSITHYFSETEIKQIESLFTDAVAYMSKVKSKSPSYYIHGIDGGRVYMGMSLLVTSIYSYKHDHGKLPLTLGELIPKYLTKAPVDYFSKKTWDGLEKDLKNIEYNNDNGEWCLKSYGRNYTDDKYKIEDAVNDINPLFYKKDFILSEKLFLGNANVTQPKNDDAKKINKNTGDLPKGK